MPEGVEVSFLTDILSKSLKGQKLKQIQWISGRYVHHGVPKYTKEFTESLPLRCIDIQNKGKVMFFFFEKGWCLISKLGMTGWWYIDQDKPTWHKSQTDLQFQFDKNILNYTDFRNFGTITITQDKTLIDKEMNQLAPDIVNSTTTYKTLQEQLNKISIKRKNTLMEDALLDQQFIVSGIGNYLKAEILYDAKISPLRPINSITETEWKQFYTSAKHVIKRMLKAIYLKDDEVYLNSMRVYQQKKDPLGNPVQRHTTKKGRTTFWVPAIQY